MTFTFDRFERFDYDFSSIVFRICRSLDSCIYVRFSRLHVNVKMFLKFSELEKSLFDVYFRSVRMIRLRFFFDRFSLYMSSFGFMYLCTILKATYKCKNVLKIF